MKFTMADKAPLSMAPVKSSTAFKSFGVGVGAGGKVDCYAPANSSVGRFLAETLSKSGAKSALSTPPPSQYPRKILRIEDIRMTGVHFDRIFKMPQTIPETESRIGPSFRRVLSLGGDSGII
jgi:hypothetical protein